MQTARQFVDELGAAGDSRLLSGRALPGNSSRVGPRVSSARIWKATVALV